MTEQEQVLGAPVPGASSTASALDSAMERAVARLGWSPQMQARLAEEMRAGRLAEGERRDRAEGLLLAMTHPRLRLDRVHAVREDALRQRELDS